MRINVVTIFPEFFGSPLEISLVGKALDDGTVEVVLHDLRDHGKGVHRQIDDAPFGGGAGMGMMVEPLAAAIGPLAGKGARAMEIQVGIQQLAEASDARLCRF